MAMKGEQASHDQDEAVPSPVPKSTVPSRNNQPEEAPSQEEITELKDDYIQAGARSHIDISMDLAKGTRLRFTIEILPGLDGTEAEGGGDAIFSQTIISEGEPISISIPAHLPDKNNQPREGGAPGLMVEDVKPPGGIVSRIWSGLLAWPYTLANTLFGLALLVYLSTRLVGLVDYPVYFFTDEAVQSVLAADLVRDGFKNEEGVFLPTYLKNGNQYNLSLSVYLQIIPYILAGKSVFVTRVVSVLLTLVAAVSIALMLRDVFKIHYWWSGVLFLSITPAWFLHSRTAFEAVEATAFYAGFLYLYLLYRYRSPSYLYAAMVLGALAFYTYSPAQLVVVLTGILLLISDWRYHWQHRPFAWRGLGLLILLALPYVRFQITQPQEGLAHLQVLHSYWMQPIPFSEKIRQYLTEYGFGLSPGYWFVANDHDLIRHIMKGYGHILFVAFPFACLGLFLALKNIRSSAQRVLLIALLAAPSGAALVEIGVTRVLFFIIPATLLTAIGVSASLEWLAKRGAPSRLMALSLFLILSLINFGMLRDALINGPTWYHDYGLGGLQYGARPVFAEIKKYLKESPDTHIVLSPAWANGTDLVARFFLPEPLPIKMGSIEGYLFQRLPLDESMLLIMIPDEYQEALASEKLTDIRLEKTLPYPDGRPGFYFVRMRYVDNIDEIFSAERQARRQPLAGEINLDGQVVAVKYPYLDMGEIQEAFDLDVNTLIRTLEANPLTLVLDLPEVRQIDGLTALVGGTPTRLTVRIEGSANSGNLVYTDEASNSPKPRQMTINFGESISTNHLEIEIENLNDSEPAHVHLWELSLHWFNQTQ